MVSRAGGFFWAEDGRVGAVGPSPREALDTLLGGRIGPGYVLGIDQATESGWALVSLDTFQRVASGVAVGFDAQCAALDTVQRAPLFDWRNVLVIMEDHSYLPAAKGFPSRTLLSLGSSRGEWATLLTLRGAPVEARLLVAPPVWRRVLGARGGPVQRADWKSQAKLWAHAFVGSPVDSDDECEALCIAAWGSREGIALWAKLTAELRGPRPKRPPRADKGVPRGPYREHPVYERYESGRKIRWDKGMTKEERETDARFKRKQPRGI